MSQSGKRYAFYADMVLLLHSGFALFAVVGGFFFLLFPGIVLVHIPVVLWSSLVNLANWTCPLTPLEQGFRRKAGQETFEGGWIQHYFEPLIRPMGMPRRLELVAGISILVWNLLVYAAVLLIRGMSG